MSDKVKKLNTSTIRRMKVNREPIAMITAYDYPSAKLAQEAGADILLVGDSLGMVVLGYDSTIPVTLEDMIHHSKAVTRGADHCFVVADLPFATYHGSIDRTIANAARLMQEGRVHALKLEGGAEIAEHVEACVRAGIPVMGHIGLTPQSVLQLGGWKIQGKSLEQAEKLVQDAKALEQAGAFSIVLEMVPEELAAHITEQLTIPTIGIGSGRYCDGQVLVYHDVLNYATPIKPRFVKQYADIGSTVQTAIAQYVSEVKNRKFPGEENVYHNDEGVIDQLKHNSSAGDENPR
ncbi:3-methyl-2-oxobutanoate hydroxymethyltransferase [Insulibacter thermoxylanivorax]|uniref:3-methyl-2-oxobutanoate hydroxymethyltransferase n=1 Tax=Insulibacter thermoxylanivorax TaxID=2749268 RepID=A0A916QD58_9BACL|nr:3-methyl-2-oxobutanoate hydroxymethyltransferase [Insulibacter thermoxylanivorax]GFR36918.1 3-methyl-2-oxobutanoate hydroxymethyltransferase [Insulibacter thermoxylanivorax]